MSSSTTFGGTIKLSGESEYRQAIKNISSELRTYKSEMQKIATQYSTEESQQKKLTESNKTLTEAIEKQKEKIELLKAAYEKNKNELGENDSKTQSWKNQLIKAETELIKMENELDDNEQALDDLEKEEDENVDSLEDFGEAAEDAGDQTLKFGDLIKANLISDAILSGIRKLKDEMVDFAKETISTGMDFETAMSQVAATMGVTTDEIGDLEAAAKEMGATTAYSATEAAEGLNILAMSGLSADEQIEVLPDVLNLAAAGAIELDEAATYVTTSIKGFGDSCDNAQYYADLMAKGATLANTNVTELGTALSSVSANASSYSQSADTMTVSLLRLAEGNITGEEAATSLSRAMADLYTPTSSASSALEELGVSCYDQQGNARSLTDVISDLEGAMSGMTEEEQAAYKNSIFTTNGLKAYNAMVTVSDETVESWTEELASASDALDGQGSAAEQASTQLDNLEGDMTLLNSATEGFKIAIYDNFDTPLRSVTQQATNSISNLQNALTDNGISGFINQLGAECQTWFNSVLNMIGNLSDQLPEMIPMGVEMVLNFVEGAISNMPALISAGADLIANIVKGLVNSLPTLIAQVPKMINEFWAAFDTSVFELVAAGAEIIATLITGLIGAIPDLVANAGEIVLAITNTISHINLINVGKTLILNLASGIAGMAGSLMSTVSSLGSGSITNILSNISLSGIGTAMINGLQLAISGMAGAVTTAIEGIGYIITSFMSSVSLIDIGIAIISGLITAFQNMTGSVSQAITDIGNKIKSILSGISLTNIGKTMLNTLVSAITGMGSSVKSAVSTIGSKSIKNILSAISLTSIGKTMITGLKTGISNMASSVKSAATSIGSSVKNVFSGISLRSIGQNLIKGLWNGISDMTSWIISKLKGFSNSVLSGIKSFFGINSPSTVFRDEVGVYLAQGVGLGFEDEMQDVTSDIQNAIPTDYDMDLNTAISNGNISAEIMAASSGVDITSLESKLDTMIDLFDTNLGGMADALRSMKIVLNNGVVAGELAPDIDQKLGAIYRLKERGV